jgi:AbrB family transcriptional regulator, transcriptional pleiotropic regulator of transition state genes
MESKGTLRKLDQLGRIVIPKELCKTLSIEPKDSIEFFTNGDTIVLKKYVPGCLFCGSMKDITKFKEKNLCSECLKAMK